MVSLGGQTAINLAERLHDMGVKIIGTDGGGHPPRGKPRRL